MNTAIADGLGTSPVPRPHRDIASHLTLRDHHDPVRRPDRPPVATARATRV
ncbi:hypothetical protein ABZ642_25150 [Streptomyces sp. NPDC007157]|uniref:hypothetical protein n=1 Tax=Streptomyces sp. NPDC007157 TaxID=3154681 RepID=UPI0033D98AC2